MNNMLISAEGSRCWSAARLRSVRWQWPKTIITGAGGAGNWSLANSGSWWLAINTTTANPHTVTGTQGWVNQASDLTNSIAYIGYVSTTGSGGANGTSNYSGIPGTQRRQDHA